MTGAAVDSGKWIRELREERFVKSSVKVFDTE